MDQDSFLYRWLRKQQKKNDIKEGMGTGFKHRSAYHREFRGYSEVRIPMEKGKYRIERVYIAPWYLCDITDFAWVMMKVVYGILTAVAAALFVLSNIQQTVLNYSAVTVILQGAAAITITVAIARIVILLAAPRKMTTGQCDAIDRPLKRWLLLSFSALTLLAVWDTVFLGVFLRFEGGIQTAAPLLFHLGAAVIMFFLWLFQHRMRYSSLENETVIDDNKESYVIK